MPLTKQKLIQNWLTDTRVLRLANINVQTPVSGDSLHSKTNDCTSSFSRETCVRFKWRLWSISVMADGVRTTHLFEIHEAPRGEGGRVTFISLLSLFWNKIYKEAYNIALLSVYPCLSVYPPPLIFCKEAHVIILLRACMLPLMFSFYMRCPIKRKQAISSSQNFLLIHCFCYIVQSGKLRLLQLAKYKLKFVGAVGISRRSRHWLYLWRKTRGQTCSTCLLIPRPRPPPDIPDPPNTVTYSRQYWFFFGKYFEG
jgi:hypothetical protein